VMRGRADGGRWSYGAARYPIFDSCNYYSSNGRGRATKIKVYARPTVLAAFQPFRQDES
jgi:hypothetical protein